MKRSAGAQSLVDKLRSKDGFEQLMARLGGAPAQHLTGNLRMYAIGVTKTFAPGEKSTMVTSPLEHDFELKYVVVPEDVCFEKPTCQPRFFFHHDDIIPNIWKPGSGSLMPASLILNADSWQMQMMDIYKKHIYRKGEVFELGVFENVGDEPLVARAAVSGNARLDEDNVQEKV